MIFLKENTNDEIGTRIEGNDLLKFAYGNEYDNKRTFVLAKLDQMNQLYTDNVFKKAVEYSKKGATVTIECKLSEVPSKVKKAVIKQM